MAWGVQAENTSKDDHTVVASGKAEATTPGWTIATVDPVGWTADCCQYARAIGVNLVLYRGDWTGEPDRVMVLNVWPRKLPTLDAEWQDDRKHYFDRDPAAKLDKFAVKAPKAMQCSGGLYHGTDHVDDVVVFCDPGTATGIHFSWSMTLAANGTDRQQVLDQFQRVVEQSVYMKYDDKHPTPDKSQH
jgi:hypothetical protein